MDNVAFLERRREERIIPKDDGIFVKLAFSYLRDKEIIKPVNDISPSGLSFMMEKDEGYILPGSPLNNITLIGSGYEKNIHNSIVRNCTQINSNDTVFNRVGIEFLLKPFEKSIIRRKLLSSYKLRLPRYSRDLAPLLNWKISFTCNGQNVKCNSIINFSKYGIAFYLGYTSSTLKISDVLSDFKITIDGELIYEGECTIVSLENSNDGLSVRCSLKSGNIDLERISVLGGKSKTAEEINTFLLGFKNFESIDPEFKAEVTDLRYFLEKLESRLDIEEQKINSSNIKDEYKNYYREQLLNIISRPIFKRLDKFFTKIRTTVNIFHQTKYNLYKHYFQENLLHFFLKAPFVNRSHYKPFGFAGDYETMNMIYKNPYAGDNLFSKLINKHAWLEPAAQAVRNRIPYFISKMNDLLNSSSAEDNFLRVMSVGCGSAVEIQEMLMQNRNVNKYIFTLIDADVEALLYCQDTLINLIRSIGLEINIKFVNLSVDQIIKDKNLEEKLGKQDLIYSAGLFDYLSKGVCKKTIGRLYSLLNKKGKLIVGNFNHSNTTRTYMEYIQEWYLFYRSKEEMLEFAGRIDGPKNLSFETENTNITNFLIIEKEDLT